MTNPFRKPKNPFRKSEGTVTLGPLEVQGFTAPDALAREVDPIQAGLRIAQRESNQPAMARSQATIDADQRRSASGIGTAFHLAADAGASVLLPGADDPRATAVRRIAAIQDAANTTDDSDVARSVRALTGWTLPRRAPRGLTADERAQIARLQSIVGDPNVRGATERLNAYVAAGGDPNAPLFGAGALQDAFKAHANDSGPTVADALGASAATGAVSATVGLNSALPNAGAIERGMGVRQIGAELFKGAATEGATGAILAAAGGADPRQILEQGATQAGLGAAIRGLHGANSIREAILRPRPTDVDLDVLSGRQEFITPEGRGRVLRDDTPPSVVSRDAQGREVLSDGRVIASAQDLAARYPEPFEPRPVRILTGLEASEARLRREVEGPPILPRQALEAPRVQPPVALSEPIRRAASPTTAEILLYPHLKGLPIIEQPVAPRPPEPPLPPALQGLPLVGEGPIGLPLVGDRAIGIGDPPRPRPRSPAQRIYTVNQIQREIRRRMAPPSLDEAGAGAPRLLAGTAGGIGGAAYGATQGDTPQERAKNALLYGLGGLALGATGGYLAERVGAKSAAVLEAEREAGKSLAQAARVDAPSEPSPFRDAPTPRPSEHGPVQGTPYVRLDKFGMDRDATARLRVEAERIGREVQGSPRRVVTWDEWRETAASLGLGDVTRKDYRAMTAPDLLAIRNLVATNTDRLIQLDTEARAPGVSDTELARMNLETSALNSQNDLLLRKFIPARTEAGRTLNSLRIIASRNFEPAWWLAKAQDIKGAPLNDAELAQVRGLLNAQDREGLVQAIARLRQASGLDKAVSYWKANLLSSPKTHLVNTAANAALGALETVKDAPAALTDQLLSLATGRRTVAGPSLLQLRAAAEGAGSGAREGWAIVRGRMAAEDLAKLDIPKETHFDNPIVEGYTQGVFRFLSAADRIPRMAAMRRALANQAEVLAHTEGLTGEDYTARVHDLIEHPTSEMAVQATAEAEQAVVQDQTAAGTALRAVGKIPVVGQFIMPFQRTPGAVATRIGEYTFGAPYELGNVARLAAQGKLKDIPVADQRRIAMLTGRGATGASLIALGALAYHRGWLTGPPADWRKDRSQATTDALRGVQGNSIVANIGGHRIQFDIGRLSPVGNLVAIGAMSAQAAEDRDPDTSPWAAGMLGAITTVANQPFLQGIQNVTEAANDPSRFGEKLVGGIARGFIPASGLLGAVTRMTDTNARITEGIPEQLQAQIPGASRMLPTRPNPLGEPTTRQGGVLGAVSQVSPVGMQEQPQGNAVLDALGQYDVTVNGFTRKTDESMADYQARAKRTGQLRSAALAQVLDSPAWQADTSFEGRQEMLQKALRKAANAAAKVSRNPFAGTGRHP